MTTLLEIDNLQTHFFTSADVVKAVDGITYDVAPGETVTVASESSCRKSVSATSVLHFIADPSGRAATGNIRFDSKSLSALSGSDMRNKRGRDIGMIFQEPMTPLLPVLSIERPLTETLEHHLGSTKVEARKRAVELLRLVGISEPERYRGAKLQPVGGQPPDLTKSNAGCSFRPRCEFAQSGNGLSRPAPEAAAEKHVSGCFTTASVGLGA
ncbi:MAG: hypothetical protein AAGB04_08395 [Pseudomonadota bacterium]